MGGGCLGVRRRWTPCINASSAGGSVNGAARTPGCAACGTLFCPNRQIGADADADAEVSANTSLTLREWPPGGTNGRSLGFTSVPACSDAVPSRREARVRGAYAQTPSHCRQPDTPTPLPSHAIPADSHAPRRGAPLALRPPVTRRRLLLVLGLAGLFVSAARPAASAPIDAEGTAYGGTASGTWTCGPNEQAKYGGVGMQVSVRPTQLHRLRDDEENTPAAREDAGAEAEDLGLVLSLAGAEEHRAFSLGSPAPGMAYASSLEIGYDLKWFGFRGGALVYQNWWGQSDTAASWSYFPETQLRFGPMDGLLRAEVGVGSYGPSTMLRPGAWIGLIDVPHPGWEIALRAGGVFTTGVAVSGGSRFDLAFKVPIVADSLQLGLGGSLSSGIPGEVDPEGRVMIIAHAW